MKSFEDFWNTLTEDDFVILSDYINGANKELAKNPSPEKCLGNQIATDSLLMTRFILGKYHKWLSEQL